MAEDVLGIGHQRSARDVVAKIEHELRASHGIPRAIVAQAGRIEITAQRQDFEGEFDSYTLRVRQVADGTIKSLKAVAAEFSDTCATAEEDGWHVFRCQAPDPAQAERASQAVDKLSACVALPEVWRVKGENYRQDHVSVELLFKAMAQYRASDIHLSPGEAPIFRIDGQARRSDLMGALSAPQILALLREIAPEQQWSEFRETKQTSFSFHQLGVAYSRVSALVKAGTPHLTIRFLRETVPSFEELNIPTDTMEKLADLHQGLVLVTGMSGSGKTTTVAAMVDWINTHKSVHILTIENPVEYVHRNKKSIVSQRATGQDVNSFRDAVTAAPRHDPDVIMIGEMHDADTIRSAINAAATGHLVISTLHSNTAYEVLNRIVSFFEPVERELIRTQLQDALKAVVCQRLIPCIGEGRVPALEIMFNDIKPIKDGIIVGDGDAIRIGMQQKISHSFIFEDHLLQLYRDKKVDMDHAKHFATDVSILEQMVMGTYTVPRLETIKALASKSKMFATGQ